mmetsp:Transcript_13062/g.38912  ORF Transcript_13062/g.38912 Transcript_13062/m.38912 type:complete len:101 (+) Transcript_13062:154-456(+)
MRTTMLCGALVGALVGAAAFAPRPHIDAPTNALRRAHSSITRPSSALAPRASTALGAARKKTADMTEEEKAAETAMNQKLLAAKGALFVAAIAYFAFTSL